MGTWASFPSIGMSTRERKASDGGSRNSSSRNSSSHGQHTTEYSQSYSGTGRSVSNGITSRNSRSSGSQRTSGTSSKATTSTTTSTGAILTRTNPTRSLYSSVVSPSAATATVSSHTDTDSVMDSPPGSVLSSDWSTAKLTNGESGRPSSEKRDVRRKVDRSVTSASLSTTNGERDSVMDSPSASKLSCSWSGSKSSLGSVGASRHAARRTLSAESDLDSVMDSPPASKISSDWSTCDLATGSTTGSKLVGGNPSASTVTGTTADIESRFATVVMEGEEACTVLAGCEPSAPITPLTTTTCIAETETATVVAGGATADRKRHVQSQARRAHTKHSDRPLAVLAEQLTNAESVDVCFLVDCTGSMGMWIRAVRSNITMLYQRIQDVYNRRCHIRAAFVGYSDFIYHRSSLKSEVQVLEFTTSPTDFHDFVSKVQVAGGEDLPEDVMTGFDEAFHLSWRDGVTKLIIHIADSPCHGTKYHNVKARLKDRYPSGDPYGRDHTQMMRTMATKNIQYYFGEVTGDTSTMIDIFNTSLKQESHGRQSITTFKAISPESKAFSDALFSAVRSSIFHTLMTASANCEERPDCREVLNILPADFTDFKLENATAMKFEMPASIDTDILTHSSMKLLTYDVQLRICPKPFAQGNVRLAYLGLDVKKNKRVVLKKSRYTNPEYNRLKRYLEDMEAQAVTARFIAEFKKALPSHVGGQRKIEVLAAKVIKLQTVFSEEDRYMVLEPYLSGEYSKFSNNGYSQCAGSELEKLMQAFSHWTYWRSQQRMIVVDLQGSVHQGITYLTDPAIHCADGKRFGRTTNFGVQGMRMFFAGHDCNSVCRALRLEPCDRV